ncbi:MAG: carbon starvation CstA family protein [Bacteroidales bacterium]|nr:carbon starvation CstA family protein [Bacteroidales bacterium]
MITFLISILLLIAGYFVYGKIVERFIGVDPLRKTPAYDREDGIDYMPMPTWKVFVIQFLNIAGLGPIFGAVMGAAYGPAAYLWIVLGCIFMGAVHDFFAGMMSIESSGANMPDITGKYLGKTMKGVMSVVVSFLLLAVGVSFVTGPSDLIASLTGVNKEVWLYVIFAYYLLATLLPIDKIIGNIYPYMGAALLFMALGVGIMLVVGALNGTHQMIELTPSTLKNWHFAPESNILVPMLFIVVSCGAISGFHSTQSPLMARCLKNEKYARPVFYGAMIAEGVVAMIWATAAMAYFGGPEGLNAAMSEGVMIDGVLTKVTPAIAVDMICRSWLGKVGAVIAVIGVVVCPITSGDTAFRSLRLTLADFFKSDQKPIFRRFIICIPIFALAYFCCRMDFSTVWNYVGIGNQLLATIVLWTSTAYLISRRKPHWMCSVPAAFLSFVCVSYFLMAPYKAGGLHLNPVAGYVAGTVIAVGLLLLSVYKSRK